MVFGCCPIKPKTKTIHTVSCLIENKNKNMKWLWADYATIVSVDVVAFIHSFTEYIQCMFVLSIGISIGSSSMYIYIYILRDRPNRRIALESFLFK